MVSGGTGISDSAVFSQATAHCFVVRASGKSSFKVYLELFAYSVGSCGAADQVV